MNIFSGPPKKIRCVTPLLEHISVKAALVDYFKVEIIEIIQII